MIHIPISFKIASYGYISASEVILKDMNKISRYHYKHNRAPGAQPPPPHPFSNPNPNTPPHPHPAIAQPHAI